MRAVRVRGMVAVCARSRHLASMIGGIAAWAPRHGPTYRQREHRCTILCACHSRGGGPCRPMLEGGVLRVCNAVNRCHQHARRRPSRMKVLKLLASSICPPNTPPPWVGVLLQRTGVLPLLCVAAGQTGHGDQEEPHVMPYMCIHVCALHISHKCSRFCQSHTRCGCRPCHSHPLCISASAAALALLGATAAC